MIFVLPRVTFLSPPPEYLKSTSNSTCPKLNPRSSGPSWILSCPNPLLPLPYLFVSFHASLLLTFAQNAPSHSLGFAFHKSLRSRHTPLSSSASLLSHHLHHRHLQCVLTGLYTLSQLLALVVTTTVLPVGVSLLRGYWSYLDRHY